MLIVTVCVGSSCSLRGSDEFASEIHRLMLKEKLEGQVDIVGAFCMDACSKGVSVKVGDRSFSNIRTDEAEAFFYREIAGSLGEPALTPTDSSND